MVWTIVIVAKVGIYCVGCRRGLPLCALDSNDEFTEINVDYPAGYIIQFLDITAELAKSSLLQYYQVE